MLSGMTCCQGCCLAESRRSRVARVGFPSGPTISTTSKHLKQLILMLLLHFQLLHNQNVEKLHQICVQLTWEDEWPNRCVLLNGDYTCLLTTWLEVALANRIVSRQRACETAELVSNNAE